MRKLLTGALALSAASATLIAGVATAQAPAEGSLTVTASSKAGTKKKPKNVKLTFKTAVTTANASADTITITLPKQLKLSGKGFRGCDAEELAVTGPTACPPGSSAGPTGSANALVGPSTSPTKTPLVLDVSPFVEDSNTLLFYLKQQGGAYVNVVKGEITSKGSKIAISLPQDVRQPVPGVDASLVDIEQTFSGKRKKNYIVSSVGCKNKKYKISAGITFAQRADGFPPPGAMNKSVSVSCKK